MANYDEIFKLLKIESNEVFEILDKDNRSIKKQYLLRVYKDKLELRCYNPVSYKWLKKSDDILGRLVINVINGEHKLCTLKRYIDNDEIELGLKGAK